MFTGETPRTTKPKPKPKPEDAEVAEDAEGAGWPMGDRRKPSGGVRPP